MNSKKFTLLELLVIIAIIGILATLLLPSLSKARERVKTSVCVSNIKQIHLGFILFSNENNGKLPGPLLSNVRPAYTDENYKMVPMIAEYVGYPKATSNKQIMTILDCPGFTSSESGADSVDCILFKTFGKNSSGERYFGYPETATKPESAPKFLAELEEPSEENSLMEVDKQYGIGLTASEDRSLYARHGTKGGNFIRTRLFFDGHAAASTKFKSE